MTRAAFQASFSDFRLVKSRKIAQFVLEVPLEGADAALAALGGLPRPDQEAWVAVARIDPQAAGEAPTPVSAEPKAEERERRAWNDLPAVQQAGIRCGERAFWRFLEFDERRGIPVSSAEHAAQIVRRRLGVTSRSALLPGTPAELRWQAIEAAYQNWLASEKYAEVVR